MDKSQNNNFIINNRPLLQTFITAFLKLSATANHYMGDRRTRGPLTYHNISLSRKGHAIALFSANTRKIIVKVAHKLLFFIHQFKVTLLNNDSSQFF
jgi:hypothetical protein